MLFGVDTHTGYGPIDVAKFQAAGGRFIWAKCTEGNKNYVDEQFRRTVSECQRLGVPVGAYHYAFCLPDHPDHPGRGPEEEAERAFAACGGLGSKPGDLSHAVDAEHPAPQDWARWGCTPQQISDWLRRYCEHATKLWGRKPVIYTYPNWWRELSRGADVSWASEYLLWFADYGWPYNGPPPDGWVPPHMSWVEGTWSDWAVCQHSADGSSARVPGVNACPVDRNCIRSETMLLVLRGLDPREKDPPFDTVHPDVPLER